jgi:hypothetical protein
VRTADKLVIAALEGSAGAGGGVPALAADPALDCLLADKQARRARDEAAEPLTAYRAEDLERMRLAFDGFDPSYHVARWRFIIREPIARTPLHLARHRLARAPTSAKLLK